MLLAAGARCEDTRIWGITPLQTAVYHGARESADLLAKVAIVPDALYIAAGAGQLERVRQWFLPDGSLRAEALAPRPNLSDVGWPPGPPPEPTLQAVLDEAFVLAAFSGRIEVMAWLLEHGASVNGRCHPGLTASHLAVLGQRLETLRWLIAQGADVQQRDQIHRGTPLGWAEHHFPDSPLVAILISEDSER